MPQNVEAEAAMLGALLINPDAYPEVAGETQPEECYREAHREIASALWAVRAAGGTADLISVCDELARRGTLEGVGGQSYVSSLSNTVPSSRLSNAATYARIVHRTAQQRHRLHLLEVMARAYYEGEASVEDLDAYLLGRLEEDDTPSSDTQPHEPEMVTADVLQRMELSPLRFTVARIVPRGLVLVGAKQKVGKSFLMLNLAAAVACGGLALGSLQVEQGDVLYLALEDPYDRVKRRLCELIGDDASWPRALTIARSWPRLDAGGYGRIERWAREVPHPKLAIVDVLAKVRPPRQKQLSAYLDDYGVLSPLKAIADRHDMTVLVVHHARKAEDASDPQSDMQDTMGLGGAADAQLMLKRGRGEADATLHLVGRDVDDVPLALRFDGSRGAWTVLGEAAAYAISSERKAILDLLRAHGPLAPRQIAELLGKNGSTVRNTLAQMCNPKQGRPALAIDPGGRYHLNDLNDQDESADRTDPIDGIDSVDSETGVDHGMTLDR